ncbi:MAG: PRC-barrel domain-containing protein [Pseudomonadota bacterium]|jgi:sporulation protein YlmC with PRC-barrel domain
MTKTFLASSALVLALVAAPALAQDTKAPAAATPASPAASGAVITAPAAGQWRTSKLIGVDVYNNNDEKIGDISELITDSSGKIDTVVIGVGGFLGLGQSEVAVKFDQLKFVNEPIARKTAASNAPAGSSGNAMNPRPQSSTVGASTTTTAEPRMYPDHAVFNATKEQLKAMPQFKYSQSAASSSPSTK